MFRKAKKCMTILSVIGVFSVFSSFAATTNVQAFKVTAANYGSYGSTKSPTITGNYGYGEFRLDLFNGEGWAIGFLYEDGNIVKHLSVGYNNIDFSHYWLEGGKSYYVRVFGNGKASLKHLKD